MTQEMTIKNVAPFMALTPVKECTYTKIFETIRAFPIAILINGRDSVHCVSDGYPPDDSAPFQVFVPVEKTIADKKYKKHKIVIMKRAKVVSVVLGVEYEHSDLTDIFNAMDKFISENKLNATSNFRIIYHQEKRKWQRNAFLKRSKKGIITEIQVVLE